MWLVVSDPGLERLDVRVAHFGELVVAMWLCVVVFLGCLRRCCCCCLVGCLQFSGGVAPCLHAVLLCWSLAHVHRTSAAAVLPECTSSVCVAVHFLAFWLLWRILLHLVISLWFAAQHTFNPPSADPCAVQATCINIFSSRHSSQPKINLILQLSTTDILAPASMKNAANCET